MGRGSRRDEQPRETGHGRRPHQPGRSRAPGVDGRDRPGEGSGSAPTRSRLPLHPVLRQSHGYECQYGHARSHLERGQAGLHPVHESQRRGRERFQRWADGARDHRSRAGIHRAGGDGVYPARVSRDAPGIRPGPPGEDVRSQCQPSGQEHPSGSSGRHALPPLRPLPCRSGELTRVPARRNWCPRQDSNLRHPAPEAGGQ